MASRAKADSDAIVDTKMASISLVICHKIKYFELLTFHHSKISNKAPNALGT